MISIILPTFNGANYISEAIDSVIKQTYKNWELIVIDDCSSDSTNSIVEKYTELDTRIKLYKNEKNLKLPASLNYGFSLAKGDYLTWTSDDNIYKINALEKMVNELETNKNIDFVFAREEYIDGNGKKNGKSSTEHIILDDLYVHNIITACFMYRRKVYETIGNYDVSKFLVEDFDYWLRIFHNFKIGFIPEILYYYRQHENSLTEAKNKQVLESTVNLLENELIEQSLNKTIVDKIYLELAQKLFSLGDYKKMKKYITAVKKNKMEKIPFKLKLAYFLPGKITEILKKIAK